MQRKFILLASAALAILAGSATVHAESGGGGGGGDSGAPAMMLPPASTPATYTPAAGVYGNRVNRPATVPLAGERAFHRFKDGGWVMTTKTKDGRTFIRFRTVKGSFGGFGGPPRGHMEAGYGEYLGADENGTKRWRLTNAKGEVKIFAATADGKGTAVLGVGLTH
jgi:hypothetical protein